MAGLTSTNKTGQNSNGLGPRTVIVNIAKTNISQTEYDTMHEALATGGTFSGVTNDAFTVAGISCLTESGVFTAGTTDAIQVALQGTGTINEDASNALGVTGAALTVVADFDGSI
jgi:uncharacterized protein YjhX (UPF0386 family)